MAITRRVFAIGGTAAAAIAPFADASADEYPSRPVQLIVPYAPGGSGDLLARLLGNQLSKLWGQQVVIENKPGAGGLIGTEAAAKSSPDGYTLYLATDGPLTIAATLHRHLPYDWKRDFTPISMMAVGYQILLTSPKLPATNLKDFIALAKRKPRQVQFRFDRRRQRAPPGGRTVPVDGRPQAHSCALSGLVAAVHRRIDIRRRCDVHGWDLDGGAVRPSRHGARACGHRA